MRARSVFRVFRGTGFRAVIAPEKSGARWVQRLALPLTLSVIGLTSGCAIGSSRPAPSVGETGAPRSDCPVAAAGLWQYRVRAGEGASTLQVEAEFPPGVPSPLGVDRYAEPYVEHLQVCQPSGLWEPVRRVGRSWPLPVCSERGCAVRYQFALRAAAEKINRFGYAAVRGQGILSPPTTWLLHPQGYGGSDEYRFHVSTAQGESINSGVWSATSELRNTYQAPARLLFEAPYTALGRQRRFTVTVGASRLRVSMVDSSLRLQVSDEQLTDAIRHFAQCIARYYGQFPVPEVAIVVVPTPGAEMFGMELGNGGASILLFVGQGVQPTDLDTDWVIVHEMFHLGFPSLPRMARFWAEGLATYQEGVTRVREGQWTERDFWTQMVRYLPRGMPQAGDLGLGNTRTWGRTYWGGALLFLLLDIELHSHPAGADSLQALARKIWALGGNTGARWPLERVELLLERFGGPRAWELYKSHTEGRAEVDLSALFADLGVQDVADGGGFDDSAPLAAVRKRLLAAPSR